MTCSDFTFDQSSNQLSLTATSDDYNNEKYKPGVFKVTITGTAGSLTQTAVIEFTLLDPCDPPVPVTAPTFIFKPTLSRNHF